MLTLDDALDRLGAKFCGQCAGQAARSRAASARRAVRSRR